LCLLALTSCREWSPAAEADEGPPEPSARWLAFTGSTTGNYPLELRALKLEGLTPSASVPISEGVSEDLVMTDSWSPDGRHLIGLGFSFDDADITTLFHVDFSHGQPASGEPLPGIPVGRTTASRAWARDSSALVVETDDAHPELYLVHLTGEGMETELLFSDESSLNLEFCANPRWFYRQLADTTRLVDSRHPEQEAVLWPEDATLSPDGRFLLHASSEDGVLLAPCGPDSQVVKVSDQASASGFGWSADGRFVSIDSSDGTVEVLDSEHEFQRVWTATERSSKWSATGARLLVAGVPDENGESAIDEVDFGATPPRVTSRTHFDVSAGWGILGDDTLLAARGETDGLSSWWLLETASTTWRVLATGMADAWPTFTPDEKFAIFLESPSGEAALAFSLHEQDPMGIPLPAPLGAPVTFDDFYAGGLLFDQGDALEVPYDDQLVWAPLGEDGFGSFVSLSDIRFATGAVVQPGP